VLRSILVAVVATVVFGGIAIVLASTFWGGPMTTKAVYVLKVIYGATISVPITLVALRAALSERQKSRR
jgi:hypothetical protein